MTPRFYTPLAHHDGDLVALPAEEAAHLTRVLRLEPGDAIRVFNGRGGEFEALVDSLSRAEVRVRVGAACAPAPEPRVAVTLAQAVLKGDKMDDVVRDAVMMGVAAVLPVVTARSEVTLASLARGRRRERWARVAIASAKQCGRATVPPILEPRTFADAAAALSALTLPGPGLMFVEPSAGADAAPLGELAPLPPRETTAVVGPEGGWTREEVERGAAACRLVTLGGRTLRADAMALVALSALFALWREF
ncbi:MAG: 16S rRNA (uracil(1498)-N(3))-methyltransferase [Acidobacteria bacterium]|nr:16S rRNA (uracil(1498)-N(3))-methyltransferase [Acidobacteriota bacterium]